MRTFGILNVVFAGLGVLGLAMTYMLYFSSVQLDQTPLLEAHQQSAGFMSYIPARVQ